MIRVTIKDKEALNQVTIEQLKKYLKTKGWYFKEDYSRSLVTGERVKVAEVWSMDTGIVAQTALIVPNSEQLADYAARMAENLIILEKIENRSQLEIYVDITNAPISVKPSKK